MKYLEKYRRLHATYGDFTGDNTVLYADQIQALINSTGSKTILDYGSGQGIQYSSFQLDAVWGVTVDMYEPGIESLSVLKDQTYDGVICVGVMDHVPEEEVDETLKNIFDRASKFAFFLIDTNEQKNPTNPMSAELIFNRKSSSWWEDKISLANKNNIDVSLIFRDKNAA